MERSFTAASDEMVWLLDAEQDIIFSNAAVRLTLGYEAAALVGRRVAELATPDDREVLREAINAAYAHPELALRIAIRLQPHTGDPIAVRSVLTAGVPAGALRRVTIISRRTDDPGSPADLLAALECDVRSLQKWGTLGPMAIGMAGDLTRLLASASEALDQALRHQELTDAPRVAVGAALAAARHAGSVTRSLVTLGQELSEPPLRFSAGDVVDRALEVVQLLSRPHVHVRSDVINGSHMIAGSENQIYRALMNLCINALEAMESSGGILELRLDTAEPEIDLRRVHPHLPPGACVRITVRDEGKGMAPEMLPRIFDQSFTTKNGGLNVGLGLTVARGIVRSHGGAIKAESNPGRGSSFSIYLPAT